VLWSERENDVLGWHQGRVGFGPASSITAQHFRQMLLRGVPKPITDVVEWFTYVCYSVILFVFCATSLNGASCASMARSSCCLPAIPFLCSSLDGERLRWGRWYRIAGFYTSIFLWYAYKGSSVVFFYISHRAPPQTTLSWMPFAAPPSPASAIEPLLR
jgi:hypothetical protein